MTAETTATAETSVSSSALGTHFPNAKVRPSGDCPAFDLPAEDLLAALTFLRDEKKFDMLVDVTAIDWGEETSPRFSVVHHLLSTTRHEYIRIVAPCSGDESPTAPSAVDLFPAANWHERETYDMFGIRFEGHPDLRRILMWEGYPYFPLRKGFPLAGFETDLPDEEIVAETGVKVKSAPMAGGPFVAPQKDHMSQREPRARDESWNERSEKPSSG